MLFLTASSANAQYILKAIVRDNDSKTPMTGVSLQLAGTKLGTTTDSSGIGILKNIPQGKQIILFSFIGYETKQIELNFPLNDPENPIEIFLKSQSKEEDEVIITSTRSTRTISNIPTRVEFISGEELDEKGNMKAGDIKMLLNESTGIQVQQTSATTANASIRIQGLDGRYTQILKDGFPIYSGAASGLSLLQTPPLDLKQVEIIKGSASTLYGGGAIAGLVNLISKVPATKKGIKISN